MLTACSANILGNHRMSRAGGDLQRSLSPNIMQVLGPIVPFQFDSTLFFVGFFFSFSSLLCNLDLLEKCLTPLLSMQTSQGLFVGMDFFVFLGHSLLGGDFHFTFSVLNTSLLSLLALIFCLKNVTATGIKGSIACEYITLEQG